MRWLICAVVGLAFAPSAFAADLDVLRGTETVGPAMYERWSGFYAGGQFGYNNVSGDFSNSTQGPISYDLRELALENEFSPSDWPVLGSGNSGAVNYGGFIGYNTQWQDVILGIEGNYSRTPVTVVAPSSPISRITPADSNGNTYLVNIDASGVLTNLQYGTLRMRAGYVLGNWLPYGFVGFALGRAEISTAATVWGQENPASPPVIPCGAAPKCVDYSFSSSQSGSEFLYGFTVGGGADVALTQNIFLRGEFEYIRFAPVSGVLVAIATARVGAGLKF